MNDETKNKVLIIEDEDLVARMLLNSLQFAGFKVQVANNGEDGIKTAKSFRPDLILLDIMMPGIDGIEVLRRLKKDSSIQTIPVVILTNLSGNNDEKYALENGATAFWVKSNIKGREIAEKIKEILSLKTHLKKE